MGAPAVPSRSLPFRIRVLRRFTLPPTKRRRPRRPPCPPSLLSSLLIFLLWLLHNSPAPKWPFCEPLWLSPLFLSQWAIISCWGMFLQANFCPLLPLQFRTAAFLSLHNIAHPGVRASCRLVSSRFCWPHLSKQVTALARTCLYCQGSKVHKHVHLQPEHIEVPRC
jgi:hypothetical protein